MEAGRRSHTSGFCKHMNGGRILAGVRGPPLPDGVKRFHLQWPTLALTAPQSTTDGSAQSFSEASQREIGPGSGNLPTDCCELHVTTFLTRQIGACEALIVFLLSCRSGDASGCMKTVWC
jgi:hypothetical protein